MWLFCDFAILRLCDFAILWPKTFKRKGYLCLLRAAYPEAIVITRRPRRGGFQPDNIIVEYLEFLVCLWLVGVRLWFKNYFAVMMRR